MDQFLKLWLDDQRPSPADRTWIRVLTAKDAIAVLETGFVAECSLDYDLMWSDNDATDWEDRRFLQYCWAKANAWCFTRRGHTAETVTSRTSLKEIQ